MILHGDQVSYKNYNDRSKTRLDCTADNRGIHPVFRYTSCIQAYILCSKGLSHQLLVPPLLEASSC